MDKKRQTPAPQRPGRSLINLPDDLRDALQREAFAHDRTLNAEITRRLRQTFAGLVSSSVSEPSAAYSSEALTDEERIVLKWFRSLPRDKQVALATLLR
jgi:plasmid stability protein